jgi:PAS domain S-box-containing protein
VAYELTPVLIPFAFATVCVFLPWYVVDELSDERYRISLVVSTIALAAWALAELLRISATTVAAELLWHNLRFVGPAFSAVGYFVFAAVYTDHTAWVRRQRLWPLFVVPVLTIGVVWTTPQLIRATITATDGEAIVMQFTPGVWYVLHAGYSYILVAVGTWWIVSRFLEFRSNLYVRKQTASVLLSAAIIMGANLAYNLDVTTLDWTPVGGALWAIIFTIAVSEYRLFDLSPLAREVVVENMESGMVVVTPHGEIIDVNHAAATMLERTDDELISTRLGEVFVTSMETVEEILASASTTDTVRGQQDGNRWYEITVSPISIPDDDDIGRVITFDDVTDRVERKQQLEAQKGSLERKNERLDEFAGVVSHDLRNPLSTIEGWAEVADDAITGEEAALDDAETALAHIQQAHDRMDRMVDDLLMLARAGQTVENTEPVGLVAVASEAWEHAAVEGCELDSRIPEDTTVAADRQRLLRIFENLYRNASDHNDSPVTIRVGLLDDADADANLDADSSERTGFYVEDDGDGISAEQRDEIFDHGYTTDSDGTGIGLSIVQDIVAAHGWRIEVMTGRDGGARFEISGVEIVTE